MAILLVALRRARISAQSVQCLSNLHQISTALRLYAHDHADRFPDPALAGTSWEFTLQEYLPNANVFRCPADEELGPTSGSSYDWRDTGAEETTLAGVLMTEARRPDVVLTFEALPGWHTKRMMNVGLLDGSCRTMDGQEAVSDLLKPIR
jgi:hypothetical protein